MKYIYLLNRLLSVGILLSFFLWMGCKSKSNDPGPGVNAEIIQKLTTGTWIMQNVSVDGIDRTSFFTGMTLSFSSSTYSASNAAPVFPSSGNWTLDPDGASITRGDGVLLIIQQLSDTSLKLGLVWTGTTYGPGRSSSIAGSHVFTFSK